MSDGIAPTIYEAFNARSLNPSEVAKTFVSSDHFDRLVNRQHSVLLGPRGSGKTTLLKMLQTASMNSWVHPEADSYKKRITYTGVFVATDISWSAQVNSLGNGELDDDTHRLLSVATFTAHVKRALIISFLQRVAKSVEDAESGFRRIYLSNDDESEMARQIAIAWRLDIEIPSLLAIKRALSVRLSRIRELASKEVISGIQGRAARIAEIDFLHIHFVDAVVNAIEIINDSIGEEDGQWALLFDELELAPQWIQEELISALRSTDQRIIYKLALSPFNSNTKGLQSPTSPAPGQDFDQIQLWYSSRVKSYKFCEALWDSILRFRGIEERNPYAILGKSYFETERKEWVGLETAYRSDSRLGRRFAKLAKTDASFREYLQEKGIDPSRIEKVTKKQREGFIRKMGPVLAVREYYRKPDQEAKNGRSTRSRKSADLYAGAASVFAISEGNPRWFIALTTRMLDRRTADSLTIESHIQGQELRAAAQRFSALLRTIPSGRLSGEWGSRGLLGIIAALGNYFHDQVVVEDFSPEPHATFKVDSNLPSEIVGLLEQALNAGALVYVPDSEADLILRSMNGKRFRLSYMLAPLYGLPLRLGPSISIGKVLNKKHEQTTAELPFDQYG